MATSQRSLAVTSSPAVAGEMPCAFLGKEKPLEICSYPSDAHMLTAFGRRARQSYVASARGTESALPSMGWLSISDLPIAAL